MASHQPAAAAAGQGILNTIINKLPIELHIPSYQYCGPGTKLSERIARGDKPKNKLDAACLQHDISYSRRTDLGERHKADKQLGEAAWQRLKAPDSNLGEKAAALFVTGVMKAKRTLGMGFKRLKKTATKKKTKNKIHSFSSLLSKARTALRTAPKTVSIREAARIAHSAVRGVRVKPPRNRIIPLPKRGGILPLLPIFAGLSALGSLAGGTSAIVKTIQDYKGAQAQLNEKKRHNQKMEEISMGRGLYLRPYKQGMGLYLKPFPKN